MFYKFYNLLYLLYLKLFYSSRIKIKGKVSTTGFLRIELSKNSQLTIGHNLVLKSNVMIAVRKNAILEIGENCFFNRNCSIVSRDSIIIHNDCMFGENVKIYDNNHKIQINHISRDEYSTEKITIEKGCWVANDTNILKGSYIPKNSVISAMSLVNKKFNKSGIYGGVPAKFIKNT